MKEYILAVLNFLHTDGLLNKLLFMKENYTSPMMGVVDFVWGIISPWFQDGLIRGAFYSLVNIAVLILVYGIQLWILCVVPVRIAKKITFLKGIAFMVGYYLLIDFLLGTDTVKWIVGITVVGLIAVHLPISKTDYSSENALLLGQMKLGGREIAGVGTEVSNDGTSYYYYDGGEKKYLRPEYKGSLNYYDDDGHLYRKNGSEFN